MNEPFNVLVIGSGIAGLSCALKAAESGKIAIVTKKEDKASATNYAQGGIAAVMSPLDDFELHIEDTLVAGAGLCRRPAVEMMIREAPRLIGELIELGVEFSRSGEAAGGEGTGSAPDGGDSLHLGREGGHSHYRIVHAHDLTGAEVEGALVAAVSAHPNITVFENHIGLDLITKHYLESNGDLHDDLLDVVGAYVLDSDNDEVVAFPAKLTLLATGGCGRVYMHTTNPDISTGDGLAMGARAGCELANMEFMQFHPTALYGTADPAFLISEAVRGFGGILRNTAGEAFMADEHPQKDLAPRDIVARAIDSQLKSTGAHYVFLDLTHRNREEIEERFPHIVKTCMEQGLDPSVDPLPVVPAAHYMCGGIQTELNGQTALSGLFAVGEVACTGVHGANRLASNSLLEGLVFAEQAAIRLNEILSGPPIEVPELPPWDIAGTRIPRERIMISHDRKEIRSLMWDYVGLVRSKNMLGRAERRLALITKEIEHYYRWTKVTAELLELRNMAQVGLMIARSALSRLESRGLHYVTDYPDRSPDLNGVDTLVSFDWELFRKDDG